MIQIQIESQNFAQPYEIRSQPEHFCNSLNLPKDFCFLSWVIKRDTVAPSQMVWRFITAHTRANVEFLENETETLINLFTPTVAINVQLQSILSLTLRAELQSAQMSKITKTA